MEVRPAQIRHVLDALGLIPSLNNGALLTLLVFFASLALTAVYGLIVVFFDQEILTPEPLPGDLTETVLQRLAGFLVIVLLAPFAEEVFFRGFPAPRFCQQVGFFAAAIISSGLFGISHIAPGSIIPAFMSGMLFAWFVPSHWLSLEYYYCARGTNAPGIRP